MNISRTALSPQSQSLDFEGKGQTMKESVPSLCTLFPSICQNSVAFGERLSRQCPVLAENKELAMYICTRAKALMFLELPQNYGLFIICYEFLTAHLCYAKCILNHARLAKGIVIRLGSWLCLLGHVLKVLPDTKQFVQSRHYFKLLHHHTTVPSFQLLDSHGFCR